MTHMSTTTEADFDAELFNYDGFDCGAKNCCGGENYPFCAGGDSIDPSTSAGGTRREILVKDD